MEAAAEAVSPMAATTPSHTPTARSVGPGPKSGGQMSLIAASTEASRPANVAKEAAAIGTAPVE